MLCNEQIFCIIFLLCLLGKISGQAIPKQAIISLA